MEDLVSFFLYQPPAKPASLPRKTFWLETKFHCVIPAYYICYPGATTTILYSHGNAEDLGSIYKYLSDLSRILKVDVFGYDYSGYGMSMPGEKFDKQTKSFQPSEEYLYADIEAAYEYLTRNKCIAPKNIIIYGRSLGSGPSCYLASKTSNEGKSVGGLILHSAFMSVYRIVLNFGISCTSDIFPNIERTQDIRCPVFIIHGTQDEVVPFSHGKNMHAAIPDLYKSTPFWAEGMGHNDIEMNMPNMFVKRLGAFIFSLEMKQKKTKGSMAKKHSEQVEVYLKKNKERDPSVDVVCQYLHGVNKMREEMMKMRNLGDCNWCKEQEKSIPSEVIVMNPCSNLSVVTQEEKVEKSKKNLRIKSKYKKLVRKSKKGEADGIEHSDSPGAVKDSRNTDTTWEESPHRYAYRENIPSLSKSSCSSSLVTKECPRSRIPDQSDKDLFVDCYTSGKNMNHQQSLSARNIIE